MFQLVVLATLARIYQIHTTGAVTIDGAAASAGAVTLTTDLVASGAVTLSMGSGSGSAPCQLLNIDTEKGFILDAAKFGGTIDIASVSASGASTVSVGGLTYSAGQTIICKLHTRCFNLYDWGSNY